MKTLLIAAMAAATNAHLLHKASKDGTYISGSLRVMGLSLVNALCADR